MNFDQYIADLLITNDCVIIPDFGGFVGNYAPAKVNPVNHRFDPPFRKISFNKLLVHNDGLLASYIAQQESVKFENALSELKDYSVYLKGALQQDQKVSFDKIGVLFQNPDGSLRFEQLKDAKFSTNSFGLDAFFGQKIDRHNAGTALIEPEKERPLAIVPEKIEEAPVQRPEPTVVIPIDRSKSSAEQSSQRRRRPYAAIAAAIALPIIEYALYVSFQTPLFKDSSHFHYSDLNPFTEKICPEYEPSTSAFDLEEMPEFEASIKYPSSGYVEIFEVESRDKTLVVSMEEKVEQAAQIILPFHIIGGCFSDIDNANGMVELYNLNESNPSIVGQVGSLHRVSVASFATKKEAMQMLASVRNEIPNAWILYK